MKNPLSEKPTATAIRRSLSLRSLTSLHPLTHTESELKTMNGSQSIAPVSQYVPKAKVSTTFKISNFSAAGLNGVNSDKIEFNGAYWWLSLYPNGSCTKDYNQWVACSLHCDHSHSNITCTLSYSLCWLLVLRFSVSNGTINDSCVHCKNFMTRRYFESLIRQHDHLTFKVKFTIKQMSPPPPGSVMAFHGDRTPQLLDAAYADVTLIAEGERLPSFKCLLCPQSAVLHAMFHSPMQEATTNKVVMEHRLVVVKAMLQFVYTGNIPLTDLRALVSELLVLAIYYQMDSFTFYLAAKWQTSLTPGNVIACLLAAQQHDQRPLCNKCLEYVAANAKTLMSKAGFMESLDLQTSHMVMRAMAGVTQEQA